MADRVLAPALEVVRGVVHEEIDGLAREGPWQVGELVRRGDIEAVKVDAWVLGRQRLEILRRLGMAASRGDASPVPRTAGPTRDRARACVR